MRTTPNAITELPPSPDDERRSRMIRYSIAMGIRLVCLIVAVIVPGWWRIVPITLMIVLPYIAVVIANNVNRSPGGSVLRPGALIRRLPSEKDAA